MTGRVDATSPLRVVQSPGDRDALLEQCRQLNQISREHQARGQAIASERRRVVRELYMSGMRPADIARETGLATYDVHRLLGLKR